MAVKAVNDTAGPDGLVPTLLVFGAYPRMTETDPPAPSMIQRATAITRAMTEITKVRAARQVSDAINQRKGPSVTAIHDTPLNSPVLVWLEGNTGQSGRWTGPFQLIGIEGENYKVQLPSGPKDFRTTVVKPYHEEPEHPEGLGDPFDQLDEEQQGGEPAHHNEEQEGESAPEQEDQTEEPRQNPGRSRQLPPRFREPDVAVFLNSNEKSIPNSLTKMPYVESRRKEINGLLDKGAFELTNLSEIPKGIRIFGSRFVNEIKNPGTDQAYEKSRLVVQAYNDKGKELILTESPTIQRVSQRIILAVAAILKDNEETPLSLYLRDISQAYVQSRTPLNRDFFVRPPSELEVPDGTILKIVRPLYGVPEAGNHWFQTYHRHHLERLKMRQSTYDPCLLYTNENGFAIVGLQTDDTLVLADKIFAKAEEERLREAGFLSKDRERLTTTTPIKFNGGQIVEDEDGIILTQKRHCQNLGPVVAGAVDLTSSRGEIRKAVTPKEQYVAQRARGAYVATVCQPEAAFDLSSAAQVTNPGEEDMKRLNKRLEWQRENYSRGLRFVSLDMTKDSLKIVVFTDSSFANNADYSSQIGFVVVLADKHNRANILHWSSTKCRRVTRSILASELFSMAHGFDIGVAIKTTMKNILRLTELPVILCTDSKSLYECLVKLGTTHEKRLMVDIMCLRQSYERRQIAEIIWIDGNSNPADAMTKTRPCQALKKLIDTNTIRIKPTGWVERTGNGKEKAEDNEETN